MNILQLDTGLFPDARTVDAALRLTTPAHRVEVVELGPRRRREMRDDDWDGVLSAILAADLVIST